VTAPDERPAQRALLERSVRGRPGSVLWDGATSTLYDVASGKALPLDWAHVAAVAERADAETGRPYCAVLLESGVELAVADQGLVFPPSTAGTGPVDGLPRAVCFRDLAAAEGRLEHFLRDHPGEKPERAHVTLFLLCLAIVDGARQVGFDVAGEERRLERLLQELEARRGG
jgi:hypothetical protein